MIPIRALLAGCLLLLCWSQSAPLLAAEWKSNLPQARLLGQGSFSWFGLPIYSANLWAASGEDVFARPFALELTYQRQISRERLVQTSLEEIRRMQGAAVDESRMQRWAQEMHQAFVDVQAGRQITGVYLPGQGARFYVDGELRHSVADEAFARALFSIWLGPQTRSPELRLALLGQDQ